MVVVINCGLNTQSVKGYSYFMRDITHLFWKFITNAAIDYLYKHWLCRVIICIIDGK